VATGSFAVPSDWSIYVIYNKGYLNGNITIESWVEQYNIGDEEDIV
jgi:hypothetical protein